MAWCAVLSAEVRDDVLKPTGGDASRDKRASQTQKDYMRALGLPVMKELTMHEARRMLDEALKGGAKERMITKQEVERQLDDAMRTVNGGPEDRGYGHPLKYVTKERVRMLVDWLNLRYPRWDERAWKLESDPFEVFDKWLCPVVAGFFPELVKTSYRHEFGPEQKWRVLR